MTPNATFPLPRQLAELEAESIEILREAASAGLKSVLLYSIGKDSSVLLHLARKAFAPAQSPFPLLHVDTTWKFRDMYAHRDAMIERYGMQLLVYRNQAGLAQGVNPFTHGSSYYTDVMKTQALRQALEQWGFTCSIAGARRDEEKSRAKERVCSIRRSGHRWDPKAQRLEFWNTYNVELRGDDSLRIFPLSNWTELDVWRYIYCEQIPVVPLYFAAVRPVVARDGCWILVDDDRLVLSAEEVVEQRSVRFRTLGCYPLTGAIESQATTLEEIVSEVMLASASERQGRLIDSDQPGSMEKKKVEGYF